MVTNEFTDLVLADLIKRVQNLEKFFSGESTTGTLEKFWLSGMDEKVSPTLRTAKPGRPAKAKKRGPGRPPKDHTEDSKPKKPGRPKKK